MKRVKWPNGEVEVIPEHGENFEFWDFGVHYKIEKFSVKPDLISGACEAEWLSELHTNRGVMLTGATSNYKEAVAQMERDIEHYRV